MVLARGSERPKPSNHESAAVRRTLGAIGSYQLRALCDAVGLTNEHRYRAEQLFTEMSRSWSRCSGSAGPTWPSDITDDGTPFEFSLAFTRATPKMRFLVESQLDTPTARSTWQAGLDLNARLAAKGWVDLARFDRVQELFRPQRNSQGKFLLWHAAVLPESGPPLFKAYLNPTLHGPHRTLETLEHALARLGHEDSWNFLRQKLADSASQAVYFSLDLHATHSARVKVYVARADSTDAIEDLVAGAGNSQAGDATDWITSLTGRSTDFRSRPPLACFAFTQPGKPPWLTLHVPVRCYVENDDLSLQAICRLISPREALLFENAVLALSNKPPADTRGMITYASLSRNPLANVDVTVYLAPMVYDRGAGVIHR